MHDGEQHVLAAWRELVGDLSVAAHVPGVGEHAPRLEAGALALDLAFPLFLVLRRRVRVVRQLGVVELEADRAAEAQVELAGGEPFGALVGLGQVGPDALDGAGQQALHFHGAGLDESCGGVLFGSSAVHLPFLFKEDLEAFLMASSARRAASSSSSLPLQKSRVFSIHSVSSSNGLRSSERKWSRPATRRRTRPARSRMRMCLDTELSEISNGAATSVTRASPEARRFRIVRRVSPARAGRGASRAIGPTLTQKY